MHAQYTLVHDRDFFKDGIGRWAGQPKGIKGDVTVQNYESNPVPVTVLGDDTDPIPVAVQVSVQSDKTVINLVEHESRSGAMLVSQRSVR